MKNKNKMLEFPLVLLEQGFRSGATLVLSILLGRSLSPENYGIYTLLFSISIILLTIQSGLANKPLVTLLHDKDNKSKKSFLGNMLFIHLLISLLIVVLILFVRLIGPFITRSPLFKDSILLFYSLAMAGWFFRDFIRQVMLATMSIKKMALTGIIVHVLTIAITLLLYSTKYISLEYIYITILITSILPSLISLFSIKISFSIKNFKQDISDVWEIGKWLLARALVNIFSGALILNARLAGTHGYEQVALFGACMVPTTILNPLSLSLGNYLLPKMTIAFKKGKKDLKSLIKKFSLILLIPLLPLNIIVFFFADKVFYIIFKDKYSVNPYLLLLFTFQACIQLYALPVNTALVAIKETKAGFRGELIAAFIVLIMGIPLTTFWGIWGVAISLLISRLGNRLYQIIKFNRVIK